MKTFYLGGFCKNPDMGRKSYTFWASNNEPAYGINDNDYFELLKYLKKVFEGMYLNRNVTFHEAAENFYCISFEESAYNKEAQIITLKQIFQEFLNNGGIYSEKFSYFNDYKTIDKLLKE